MARPITVSESIETAMTALRQARDDLNARLVEIAATVDPLLAERITIDRHIRAYDRILEAWDTTR